MRRQLTTPILVIAILHLTGGTLGILGSICGTGSLLMMDSLGSLTPATMPTRPGQPAPPPLASPNQLMKDLNDQIPGYRAFTVGSLGFSFLLDILLLSAGIGLLKVQPWACWLSLVYATLSILYHLGTFVYQLVWVLPATQAMYAKMGTPPGFSSIMTISSGIGIFVSLLFTLYPIAVLIVLLMPSTSAVFRGEVPARKEDLDDEDEALEDESWRQPPPRSDKFRQ
jgi:hypothetical protein